MIMRGTNALSACLPFLLLVSMPNVGLSQTLDDAITNRLDVVGSSILKFCFPLGGSDITSSSSGGTSIPISIPVLAQQRIRASDTNTGQIKKIPSTRLSDQDADETIVISVENFVPFAFIESEDLQRKSSRYENGRDSVRSGVTIGTSYRSLSGSISGLSVSGSSTDGELGEHANFTSSSYGLHFFSALNVGRSGALQFRGHVSKSDGERIRRAMYQRIGLGCASSPKANYATEELGIDVSYSKTAEFGQWTIAVSAGLGLQQTTTDKYSEINSAPFFFGGGEVDELYGLELTFYEDTRESIQSAFSVGLGRDLVLGRWTFQPVLNLRWIHEFAADQQELEASLVLDPEQSRFGYLRDAPDRNYFVIDVNTSISKGRLDWLLGYRAIAGYERLSNSVVSLGLNFSFD